MEDFTQLHLTSPPSSLSDGLLAPRVSTPPVPRPRKASSLSLSSTPKHLSNVRHLPTTPHTNGLDHHQNKSIRGHRGMQRAPSLDSATHRDLPLSPITRIQSTQSDSETEEDSSPPSHRRSSSRQHNGPHHGKHNKKTQQYSQSLPATPRVNSSSQNSGVNGGFPFGTSPSHGALPNLLAPHVIDQANPENISLNNTHYVTCQTGVSHLETSEFLGPQDCKLIGAIDYSSLPLPQEDHGPMCRSRDMSRHMSEPCITQAQRCSGCNTYSPKKKGVKHSSKISVAGKESGVMDNIKESGQSEGEAEEINALEVQWRFIQTLVLELNSTKANNRKLMADLHQSKMEIQMLKASLDSYNESGLQPGAITEMVGQIHAAQKVRDEAMMSRIKLANEERDAALTHSRTMMDKLSLSPRGTSGPGSSVDVTEQDLPSGGNSSCTNSPRRNDRRHRKPNDYSPSSITSGTVYTSAPPAYTQGSEQRSLGDREAAMLSQLATLEDELRTLRLATTIHHTLHEGGEGGVSGAAQGISRISAEYMEGLCSQLRESETLRWQLHDHCARLERLVNVLRKKVNGLNVVEPGLRQEGAKLTLVDLNLHGPSAEVPLSSGHHNHPTSTSSEGEPRDSLSSLESVETASASSWRRGDVPNTSCHSTTNVQSAYLLPHVPSPHSTLNTSHSSHASIIHTTLTQSTPIQVAPAHSHHSSLSPSLNHTPNASPHHHQHHQGQNVVNERDPRSIHGVTIVGPITEL